MRLRRVAPILTLATALSLGACASHQPKPTALPSPKNTAYRAADANQQYMYDWLMGKIAEAHRLIAQWQPDKNLTKAFDAVASVHFLAAAKVDHDPENAGRAAKMALKVPDADTAYQAGQLLLEKTPEIGYWFISQALFVKGDYQGAADAFVQCVEHAVDKPEAIKRSAYAFDRLGHPEKVDEVLAILQKKYPQSDILPLRRIQSLAARGDYYDALQSVNEILKDQPARVDLMLVKAELLNKMNRLPKAVHFLQDQLQQYPDSIELHMALGDAHSALGDQAAAGLEYAQLMRLEPDAPLWRYKYANSLLLQKKSQEARAVLLPLLDNPEYRHKAQLQFGFAAEVDGDMPKALDLYQQASATQEVGVQVTALNRAIIAALGLRDVASIEKNLATLEGIVQEERTRRAGQQTPEFLNEQQLSLYIYQIELLKLQNQRRAAYKLAAKALAAMPDEDDLIYSHALLAEEFGEIDQAIADLEKLVAKNPQNVHHQNALGYLLANHDRDLARAYALIQNALNLMPDSAAVMDSMGWVLYKMQRYDEAESYLKKALAQQHDAEIAIHLGKTYLKLNQRQQALAVWQQALEKTPDNAELKQLIEHNQQP